MKPAFSQHREDFLALVLLVYFVAVSLSWAWRRYTAPVDAPLVADADRLGRARGCR